MNVSLQQLVEQQQASASTIKLHEVGETVTGTVIADPIIADDTDMEGNVKTRDGKTQKLVILPLETTEGTVGRLYCSSYLQAALLQGIVEAKLPTLHVGDTVTVTVTSVEKLKTGNLSKRYQVTVIPGGLAQGSLNGAGFEQSVNKLQQAFGSIHQ